MSRKGFILFLLAGLSWGVPYLFIKLAGAEFSNASIIFSRVLVGALVLVPLALYRKTLMVAVREWRWVLVFAALEMIGPWWLITEAERHIDSGLAGLLVATVPFFSLPIAYFLGDKSVVHPKTLFGVGIGFTGLILLVGIDSFSGHIDPLYVGFMVLSAIGYAVAPAVAAHKISHVPSEGMIGLSMAIVAVVYAVPAAFTLPADIAKSPSLGAWASLLGLGVICSAIAFVVFFALIKEIGSARATLITYPNTAVAILLGVLVARETFTLGMGIGLPLVALGSYFASRKH
ncbi:MAG: DMT family transporter [Actinomycetales bacterium]|nr:DMT family transporter [Actinomycetales bacterium]